MKTVLQNLVNPDESIRKNAVIRLSSVKDIRLLPILTRIAEKDTSIEIRFFAKKAIANLKEAAQASYDQASHNSVKFPTAPLVTPQATPLSAPVAAAIATPVAIAPIQVQQNEPALAEPACSSEQITAHRLSTTDPFERIKIIQELVQLKNPHARLQFLALLESEEHPHVRATLALAIGIVGEKSDATILAKLLDDENPRTRANAVEGLGLLGNASACQQITPLVKDADNRVRANALTALARFQREELLMNLSEMVDSPDKINRDSVAYALVKLELPDAIPLLERLLNDNEISIRLKARNGLVKLAKLGHPTAMNSLCAWGGNRASPDAFLRMSVLERLPVPAGLNSEDRQERLRAIHKVIEVCSDSQSLVLFRRLAMEQDTHVKASLITALGQIGAKDAFDAIAQQLKDKDPRIQANSIEALGLLDGERAASLVFPFLNDANNRIRANAVVTLSQSPHVNVVPSLKQMISEGDSGMQASAIYAITELAQARYVGLLLPLLISFSFSNKRKAHDVLKILSDQGILSAWTIFTRWGDSAIRES